MTSYFEIGGMIVEAHMPVDGSAEPPRIFRRSGFESSRIESSYGSMDTQNPQGFSDSKKHHAVAAGGDPEMASADKWGRRALGQGLVRIGAIGLMVPDPIPLVDEIIFAGMIGVGVAIHATTW